MLSKEFLVHLDEELVKDPNRARELMEGVHTLLPRVKDR
jgi:hypothetical protein